MIKNRKLLNFRDNFYSIEKIIGADFYIIPAYEIKGEDIKYVIDTAVPTYSGKGLQISDQLKNYDDKFPYKMYAIGEDLNKTSRYYNWDSSYRRYYAKTDTTNVLQKTFNKNLIEINSYNETIRYKNYKKNFIVDALTGTSIKLNRKNIETIDATQTKACKFTTHCINLKEIKIPAGTDSLEFSNKNNERDFPNIQIIPSGVLNSFTIKNSKFTNNNNVNIPKSENLNCDGVEFNHNECTLEAINKIKLYYCNDIENLKIKTNETTINITNSFITNRGIIKDIDALKSTHIIMPYIGFNSREERFFTIKNLHTKKLMIKVPEVTMTIENLYVTNETQKLNISIANVWHIQKFQLDINKITFAKDIKDKKLVISFRGEFGMDSVKPKTKVIVVGKDVGIIDENNCKYTYIQK